MTEPQESLFDLPPAKQRLAVKTANTSVPGKLPARIKKRLEALGLMDPDTGATRRARACRCSVCRQSVYRGINADFGGWSVDCDPQPLTVAGELEAIVRLLGDGEGPATYELLWTGGATGYRLESRRAEHIKRTPPGTNGVDVLQRHTHFSNPALTMATSIDDQATTITPDECPY